MYQFITYEKTAACATITLNRPEVFHALNVGLMKEVTQAVEDAATDSEVRVVVLTATGDRAFCSGADLKDTSSFPTSLGQRLEESYHPMIRAIRNIEKPVICRMNGVAAGAGFSLALACDVIIAQAEAYCTLAFVGIGLMPDAGSNFFIPRIMGMKKAFELASTGRKIFMPEALQLGIVNNVVPFAELDTQVNELVQHYSNAPTVAIGYLKKVLNTSTQSSLDEVLSAEAFHQDLLGRTHDFGEGVMAFIQKRKPNFKGK
jgi:2-(1,2-epoxy-1,2-dihydrophenyl)acetyl-CoA isomerase